MPLTYSCSILNPDDFTRSTEWDIHPFLPDTSPASQSADSIKKVGILVPPLVKQRRDGKHDFILGRRCFRIQQEIEPGTATWCRILSPEVTPAAVLQLLFEGAYAHRTISPVELAHFYRLVRTHLPSPSDADKLLTALGLQKSRNFIGRSLQLLELRPEIQLRIMEGTIPENVARELLKLDQEDRETAYQLIERLKIGGGKQRRMLTLMRDVAGRHDLSYARLIGEEEITGILRHPQMNTPQKSHALLQALQNRHTPSLHEAETAFNTWKSKLELPDGCTVGHSASFERNEIILSLTFTDKVQLERSLPSLHSLRKQGDSSQG